MRSTRVASALVAAAVTAVLTIVGAVLSTLPSHGGGDELPALSPSGSEVAVLAVLVVLLLFLVVWALTHVGMWARTRR
jgi:hypothetical protein